MRQQFWVVFLTIFAISCNRGPAPTGMDARQARAIMDDVSDRNKNYQPLTAKDDAMMQRVVEFYNQEGTPNERMEAYYLLGSVYRDLHEAPKAVEAFLKGIDAADTLAEDCRYDILTRLYGQKNNILYRQRLYELALKEEDYIEKYAIAANDTLFIIDSQLKRLGRLYSMGHFGEIASRYFSVIERWGDGKFLNYIARELNTGVLANLEINNISDANRLLSIYEQHSGDVDLLTMESSFPIYYYAKGRLLTALGELDSAEMFFRREMREADWNNRQSAYRGLRELFEQRHQTDSALKYARLQCEAVDSDYQAMVTGNVQNLQQLYDYSRAQADSKQKTEELERERRQGLIVRWVFSLVLALMGFVAYFLYARMKRRLANAKLELERANAALEDKDTEENRQRAMKWQREVDGMRIWNRDSSETPRQRFQGTTVFQLLQQKAREGRVASAKDYEDVRTLLEKGDPMLMGRLKAFASKVSEVEEQTFLLLRMGMTKTEISYLTAHARTSVTSICKRFVTKVIQDQSLSSQESIEWLMKV
ncbi:MAG: hypothetical protein IJ197_00470 [Bacteroidaceae bacterium]|nr:hypothetical protein [Bacteroidaceae bacterium]